MGGLTSLFRFLTKSKPTQTVREVIPASDSGTDLTKNSVGGLNRVFGTSNEDFRKIQDELADYVEGLSDKGRVIFNELMDNISPISGNPAPNLKTTIMYGESGIPRAVYQLRPDGDEKAYLSYLLGLEKGYGREALMDAKTSVPGKQMWWVASPEDKKLLQHYTNTSGVKTGEHEGLPMFSMDMKCGGLVQMKHCNCGSK